MISVMRFQRALVALGILSTAGITNAATITADVYGVSGPWSSASNPAFNWGTAILPPSVIDSSSGLAMKVGDDLTISYAGGCVYGGWPGCYDANGWPGFGDLAPYFISPAQGPVYFMALLGAFTDLHDVIVGDPFKIGNGPFNARIPNGASKLSMGFLDGGGGFFDNGGVITVSITETSLPTTIDGGTIAPGGVDPIGEVRMAGDLTLKNGVEYVVDLDLAGLKSDYLGVDGTLNLGTDSLLDLNLINDLLLDAGKEFQIVGYGGSDGNYFKGFADGSRFNRGQNRWEIDYRPGGIYLTSLGAAAVPEPSSLALLLLAAGLLGARRRRH